MIPARSRHALLVAVVAAAVLTALTASVATAARPPAPRLEAALQTELQAAVRIAVRAAHPDARAAVVTVAGTARGWAFGTAAIPVARDAHTMPVTVMFVARRGAGGWQVATEPSAAFASWVQSAPDLLIPAYARSLLVPQRSAGTSDGRTRTATASTGGIGLPWGWGESRRLSGGPHHNGGSDAHPWSALDFAGGDGRVRAAADGVAYVPCRNLIRITHGDGWGTSYYHISGVAVAHGQQVRRGQYLGMQSTATGCGGRATGAHQHFALMRNGSFVNLDGRVIGGWTVHEGSSEYYGCLTKDGVKRCAGDSQPVYNGATALAASHAPNTPAPSSPADGHTTQDGRAPTLCWTNRGDADGNSVSFLAEVWRGSTRAADVATGGTCWRPGTLDGQNAEYSWRVKARDSTGKDSAWSASRTFTIAGTLQRPSAPLNVSATAVSPSQIRFTWEDRSANEDGFRIYRTSAADDWTWVHVATVPTSAADQYTDGTLLAETTYRYSACAYNRAGQTCDGRSNAKSATTPARVTVSVDDQASGFARGWWWGSSATGYADHHYYTYAKEGTYASWSAWNVRLAAGTWEVFAHVPAGSANTQSAPYTIHHRGGSTVRRVDQLKATGWVSLGTYEFASGLVRRVMLTDATGESSDLRRLVRADAVRLEPRP